MRNWKTTMLGIFSLIAGFIALVCVIMGKATLTEAGSYLALSLAFTEGLKGFFTKDHDK